jgi:uracil-DNA glycosylase
MELINKTWIPIFQKYDINNIQKKIKDLKINYINDKSNIEIFPKEENIFKCFQYFSIFETKVVILGQDPYHGPNQATGLCFGTDSKPPPSLKNIAAELKRDTGIILEDYSLESWAKQGILLLNASLTVIQGKPNSHMNMWSKFTDLIINELNNLSTPIIFVAWGAFAHKKLLNIDTNKHYVIVSSHPSPLSVFKKYKNYPSFFESKPFSKINNLLNENNKEIINW